jgi:CheY-like chemotaxis protein
MWHAYTQNGVLFRLLILSSPAVHVDLTRIMPMPRNFPLVLCIDDEVVGLKVRKMVLERAGYQVLTATDGVSGISVFENEPVDVVVLDYSMPGMHGGEVASRMRQIKPHVPILLLSAYIGLPGEVTSLVDLYMTKTEGAPVLLQKLGRLLQQPVAAP